MAEMLETERKYVADLQEVERDVICSPILATTNLGTICCQVCDTYLVLCRPSGNYNSLDLAQANLRRQRSIHPRTSHNTFCVAKPGSQEDLSQKFTYLE